MKKRFGILSLIGATAVLIALLGAITALAAPSAAVTGTVALDNDWYTITPSGSATLDGSKVTVTVTDADANVTIDGSQAFAFGIAMTDTLSVASFTITLAGGEEIVGTPDALKTAKTDCSISADIDSDLNVTVFNVVTGAITVQTFSGMDDENRTICFDKGQADSVNVKITSTQDPDGITVSATETGVDTDEFEVTITLKDIASSATTLTLQALDLNTVTATYTDTTPSSGSEVNVSTSSSVETGKPAFANTLPDDGFATQATQPVISATINDSGGSGIDISTIRVVIDGGESTPTVTGADGDTTVSIAFTPATLAEGDRVWFIKATDLAGNAGRTDADGDDPGDQDFKLKIDTQVPAFSSVETGKYWDTESESEKSDKLDRLVVIFNDDILDTTVSAADFTVDGLAPLKAEMFAKALQTKVYLTLSSNLAADDEPILALGAGGSVSDKAGNALSPTLAGTETAADKIAPTFTVVLSTDLTKGDVDITVSSNEKISGVPGIKVHNVDGTTIKTQSVVVVSSTSWKTTFESTATHEGDNSVVITGADVKGNAGSAGSATIVSEEFSSSSAIVFKQDTTNPVITFDPENGGEAFTAAPFVSVSFNEKITVDSAEFGVDGATASDVTPAGNLSSDRKKWIYAASGLTVDEDYTITIEVTDDAGNTANSTATFTVKEKELVDIALSPGMNLISLPSEPADSAINSVVSSDDVVSVITYNSSTGAFTSATRDANGNLSGTLTTMDAMHGYWVNSTSFAPIQVEIPEPGFAAVPPSIPVGAGWNLVPVVSLTGQISGTTNADTYFGSTAWVTAYTFTPPSTWTKVLPNTFATVDFGKGYWLYVSEAGILVP